MGVPKKVCHGVTISIESNAVLHQEAKPEPKAKKSWYGKIEDYEGTMLWDFVMFGIFFSTSPFLSVLNLP
jgi:hypothetical protein